MTLFLCCERLSPRQKRARPSLNFSTETVLQIQPTFGTSPLVLEFKCWSGLCHMRSTAHRSGFSCKFLSKPRYVFMIKQLCFSIAFFIVRKENNETVSSFDSPISLHSILSAILPRLARHVTAWFYYLYYLITGLETYSSSCMYENLSRT